MYIIVRSGLRLDAGALVVIVNDLSIIAQRLPFVGPIDRYLE